MTTTGTRAQPRVNKLFFIAYVNREGDVQKTPVSLGRTLNISSLGVGMEVFQPLAVGSIMEMEIGLATETLAVAGKVVHITPQTNEVYFVGIQFDEPQEKLGMLAVPNHP